MPLLGFRAEVAPKIIDGSKVTTIRKMRKDGRDPKRGDTLYLDIHVRTKKQRRLMVAPCTSVRRIRLVRTWTEICDIHGVWIDGHWLGVSMSDPARAERRLVRDEGFETVEDLFDTIKRFHGLPFDGLLIRWKPL